MRFCKKIYKCFVIFFILFFTAIYLFPELKISNPLFAAVYRIIGQGETPGGSAQIPYFNMVMNNVKTSGRMYITRDTVSDVMARYKKDVTGPETKDNLVFAGGPLGVARYRKAGQFYSILAFWDDKKSFTTVYMVKSDGDLLETIKTVGDVPGKDIDGLPRYPGSRRAMCAYSPAGGKTTSAYGQVIYECSGTISSVESFYRSALETSGWRELPTGKPGKQLKDQKILVFEKGARVVIVSATMKMGERYTHITIVEAGSVS